MDESEDRKDWGCRWGVRVSAGRGSGAFGAEEGAGQEPGHWGKAGAEPGVVAVKELQGLRVRCEQWACDLRAVPEGWGCLDFPGLSWGWFRVGAEGCLLGGLVSG